MSKGLAWVLALVGLVLIALLIACGSSYNPASEGLVLITSQGSALIQTFSFDLASGSIAQISNTVQNTATETCVMPGIPSSMVLDPTGTYAYVIVTASDTCPGSQTGIESLAVNSNGTIAASGTVTSDPNPVALAMDLSGKYMFVAEGRNSPPVSSTIPPVPPTACPGTTAQYGICVYGISNGTLTPVPGSFNFVYPPGSQQANFAALWPTPSAFVVQNAVCSGAAAPSSQYLYVADSANDVVWEFGVNMSTGALQNPGGDSMVLSFPAQSVPSGVVVDPCNRFVYVSNMNSNQINAFTICNGTTTSSTNCPLPFDGRLVAVSGSPFSLAGNANGPGPMVVDALGNFLYVLNTLSNTISPFRISPVSGSISTLAVVGVGTQPKSMALRSDDSWLFVTNFASSPPDISQFALSPATGTLTPVPTIATDNYPYGVAVK
jgi:6-phosphogluconolactonase (cycloisomerase 2 family)